MKKKLFLMDKAFLLSVLILLGIFRSTWVIIIGYVLIAPYLMLTKRKTAFLHLALSTAVAFIWILISKNQYYYNNQNLNLSWSPLFPFFAWSLGLLCAYFVYSHFEQKIKAKGWIKETLIFTIFYIPALLILETIAYHLLNIKNIASAAYAGLPICQCIHAPFWMQISYLLMGPVYFILCKILGLENPHKTK